MIRTRSQRGHQRLAQPIALLGHVEPEQAVHVPGVEVAPVAGGQLADLPVGVEPVDPFDERHAQNRSHVGERSGIVARVMKGLPGKWKRPSTSSGLSRTSAA